MPGYEVWVHHSESVRQTASVEEEDDTMSDNRMGEMLDEVQKFFDILRASEKSLHEHLTISVLAFVTHLMSIKSKFTFLNNYYKEL
jgi:hypothetical protein